jgi:hypothetical protein
VGEAVPKPSSPRPLRFRSGACIGAGTRPEIWVRMRRRHCDPIGGNGAASLRPAGPGAGRSCHTAIDAIGSAPVSVKMKGRNRAANGAIGISNKWNAIDSIDSQKKWHGLA